MEKKLTHATSLKIGGYVIFNGKACRVTDILTSRPGKHGHAKVRISAVGLVDGSKIIKLFPGHDKIEVPIVEKETAQILSIQGDMANVMDSKTYETFDLKISEDLKATLKEGDQVSYWIIMGQKVMMKGR